MGWKGLEGTPKLISLFAGCGGLDLPFHKQGFKVVWANDIDKYTPVNLHEINESLKSLSIKDRLKIDSDDLK